MAYLLILIARSKLGFAYTWTPEYTIHERRMNSASLNTRGQTVEHANVERLGKDLDRRLLEIARTVDPHDEEAIDMYAEQIAGNFCRDGLRDLGANLQAVDPNGPQRDFSKLTEEAMPNAEFFREMAEGIKKQIYQAMQAIGKMP